MMGYSRNQNRAGAYAKLGVESAVLSANPHRLISLLFDGAQTALRKARLHMENGNIVEKGNAISQALDIVNQGLKAALDLKSGGEVAENLDRLYDYIGRLLLQSSLHNDMEKLDKAAQLLDNIGSAWREIGTGTERGREAAGDNKET